MQQRFVSDVSHELRTPLTTIRMAADVLYAHRGDFDPASGRSTELLSAELDRFEELLTDLLEISRFDAGAAELAIDDVDLAVLAGEEVDALRQLRRAVRHRDGAGRPTAAASPRWTAAGSGASCAT